MSEMCLLVSAGIKTKITFSVAFNPNSLDYRDIDKLQDVNISIGKSISMIVKLWMTDNDKYNVHRFSRETAKYLFLANFKNVKLTSVIQVTAFSITLTFSTSQLF